MKVRTTTLSGLIAVLLATLVVTAAPAHAAEPTEVRHVARRSTFESVAYIVGRVNYSRGWLGCSGGLVGANVVVTAGHCLSSPDDNRIYTEFHVFLGQHRTLAGAMKWRTHCEATRAWRPRSYSHTKQNGTDWGMLQLGNCESFTGKPMGDPGFWIKTIPLVTWSPIHQSVRHVYGGYPKVVKPHLLADNEEFNGRLQRWDGTAQAVTPRNAPSDVLRPSKYIRIPTVIDTGGSGGPLLRRFGTGNSLVLAGVDSFYEGGHSYFQRLDDGMFHTIVAAIRDDQWPLGHWTPLRPGTAPVLG